jgi:hypothetical protein
MRPQTRKEMLGIVLLSALCCWPAVAQDSSGSDASPTGSIIERMESAQSGLRSHLAYQLLREYRLSGAKNSSVDSQVTAEINFRPPTSKDYKIQKASGSKRGEQVVRRLLDHEIEASSNKSQTQTAITRENYEFTYAGETVLDGQQCYLVELKPKRKENDLIVGEAWVDKQSFFIRRIEGEIAKTPSWWMKRVRVNLRFADIEGTWLQTSLDAVADVRIFGPHTLTSRIVDYRRTDVVASAQPRVRSVNPIR